MAVASGAAATACAASTASTGAARRATLFGRAARRFEEMGVGALLINCIPPDHVAGMVSWLRDFTDLPLGVYPNLGYLTDAGWRFDQAIGGDEYAEMALRWREEGAQIIGGCCGVGPEHIAAARERLADTQARPAAGRERPRRAERRRRRAAPPAPRRRAVDATAAGRALFPLPFPDDRRRPGRLRAHPGQLPGLAHLFERGHRRAPALPRRRLRHRASSPSSSRSTARRTCTRSTSTSAAVANTLANAFRNGVADRVSGAAVDLYPWVPEERYEVDRREPLPDARRPVRAGQRPTARSTTGAATCSTT